MHLFLCDNLENKIALLNEEESWHCSKVLRLKNEDIVFVTNGTGTMCKAKIIDNNKNKCILDIVETTCNYNKRNFNLHIAISPLQSSDRFEWFVEKAVEIGIDEITPILCERSERKKINIERLNKLVISAVKQSLKAYIPKINSLTSYSDFVSNINVNLKAIAHCGENTININKWQKKNTDCLVLIGPEGDFTQHEIDYALKNNFTAISLGNSRLRTETAAVYSCVVLNN